MASDRATRFERPKRCSRSRIVFAAAARTALEASARDPVVFAMLGVRRLPDTLKAQAWLPYHLGAASLSHPSIPRIVSARRRLVAGRSTAASILCVARAASLGRHDRPAGEPIRATCLRRRRRTMAPIRPGRSFKSRTGSRIWIQSAGWLRLAEQVADRAAELSANAMRIPSRRRFGVDILAVRWTCWPVSRHFCVGSPSLGVRLEAVFVALAARPTSPATGAASTRFRAPIARVACCVMDL